jgi:Putative metal-binding motif/FG-GAP-like repeat/FG-GAP repeat
MRLLALTLPLFLMACADGGKADDSSIIVGDDTGKPDSDSPVDDTDSPPDDSQPQGEPNIVLSPAEVDLGIGVANEILTGTLTVRNTGDATLDVSLVPNSGYSVDQGSLSIPAGSSSDVQISFSAADPGSYPGSLELTSNDPDSPALSVDLSAVIDADSDLDGAADSEDCAPENPLINPNAVEIWYNGVDENCDGNDDDQDFDGVSVSTDCDDTNPANFPGNTETWYDGQDNDCDGNDDDQDLDGVAYPFDCDDQNADRYPGNTEIWYDGVDQDCDSNDDDQDGDGYAVSVDCNDLYANINPGATEICDGIDNNCDGQADTDALGDPWYTDADGDGYGDLTAVTFSCTQPTGTVANGDDCNDANLYVSPAATEVCDGVDNDCDGTIDINAAGGTLYYQDADGDTVGGSSTLVACTQPAGYTTGTGDCDDSNAAVYPGATEIWYNNVDENCDGNDDDQDLDGSDYPADCNDSNAAIYPGATEVCDNIDNDCSTVVDDNAVDAGSYYLDADSDAYGDPNSLTLSCSALTGYVTDGTDCDDTNAAINPGATEITGNSVDENCDGSLGQILVSTAGWTIVGTSASQYAGISGVAMSADANSDGDPELLVGTSSYSSSTGVIGFHDAGTQGAAVNLTSGWTYVTGSTQGQTFSTAFTPIGDVSGDGTQDYLASSPAGSNGDGRIYVFDMYDDNGSVATTSGETVSTQSNFLDVRINGVNGERFGSSLATGDLNGDGIADLAGGGSSYYYATGGVWLFDGSNQWWTGGEYDNDVYDGFVYGDYNSLYNNYYSGYGYEYFGAATAIGDFDGDGEDDLLSCANNNNYGLGACWVVAGSDALYANDEDVTNIASTKFSGSAYGDNVGGGPLTVAAGDLDGDGDAEAVIGIPGYDGATTNGGAVAVLWGGSAWTGSYDASTASALLLGDGEAGAAVSLPGDMNGDGVGEILVGAPSAESTAGRAYMVSGDVSGSITLSTDAWVTWVGETSGDELGTAVSGGQDLDGDGVLDVALSAPYADDNGSNSGTTYILPGTQ